MTISPVACLRSLRHFSGRSARIRIPSIGELPDGSPPVRRIVSSTNMSGYLLLFPGSAVGGRGVPWGTGGRDLRLGVPRVTRGGRRGVAADYGGTRDGAGGNCCRKCCGDIETAWGEDWDLHFLVHFLGLFICSRTTNFALSTARGPGRSKAASCLPLAASCQTAAGRPAGTGQEGDNRRWRGRAAAVRLPGQGTRQPPVRRRPDRLEVVRGRREGARASGRPGGDADGYGTPRRHTGAGEGLETARAVRGRREGTWASGKPGGGAEGPEMPPGRWRGSGRRRRGLQDGTGARRARARRRCGVHGDDTGCTEAVRERDTEARRRHGRSGGAWGCGGLSGGGRRDPGAAGHRPPRRFSCRRGQPASAAVYRGTFPCLRCGGCLRLSRSIASPRATADRVCTGSITSSTRPRSAA